MRTKSILHLLIMTTVLIFAAYAIVFFIFTEANAGFPAPPGLPGSPNVHVNGYLPAPPGVHVQIAEGRPYYIERASRVYLVEEKPVKHYKKKKYYKDNGHKYGHYKGK